ncbi:hypothetical protein Pint_00749 [Pistacia integerrima]|uniref:Uncharacterized protein n=1 Tax=Pistacia integerrima TaxID=434235 RepID=A0ACC0ZQV4_9ROSI|nr:hypothetical protein Pint_00749 [Pistacia integerrima]
MMEENPEIVQRANLTSMSDKEGFELVWENGQLLMRDLPRRAQRGPSINVHPSHDSSINAHLHVKNGGDTFPQKRAGFETLDSILDNSYHDRNSFYMNFTHNKSLEDDNFHESLPEVYQTHFNVFLEQNKGDSYDKFHKDSQVVPVHEDANLKKGCHSNYFTQTPQHAPTGQPDKSSNKQYQESVSFKRARTNSRQNLGSMREFPVTKLQDQDLESDGRKAMTNFSLFLGSPGLLQVNSQRSGVKMPTTIPASLSSAEGLNNNCKRSSPCSNIIPLESMSIAPANGSKTVKGFHYQPNIMEATVELLPPAAKPSDKSLPDYESEACCREDASPNQVYGQTSNVAANQAKRKLNNTQKAIELPVASSSLCSRGASNNPTYTLKRRYNDTEGSADHPSQNIERKATSVRKEVPGSKSKPKGMTKAFPGSKSNREKRTAEFHNLSERKRRDKINKKMRALQELIPNCNKVDKVSMLDEAIEYLKNLQLQVQMMSMGNRVYMPPMLLPNGMQQVHPQMTHFSPIRMQMGSGCNPFPPHFLFPPIPGATAMPGFVPQLLPMSLLPAQLGLGLLNTTVRLPAVSPASAPTQPMVSATPSNSKDSIHNIIPEEGKSKVVKSSKIHSPN